MAWIISQNKTASVNTDNIEIIKAQTYSNTIVAITASGREVFLGKYETEEAVKELAEWVCNISDTVLTVKMPQPADTESFLKDIKMFAKK